MSKKGSFYGLPQGFSLLLAGSPGTGKSHFLASVCEVVPPEKVDLIITKPRELESEGYARYGLVEQANVFSDVRTWRPHADKYEATAWSRLLDHVYGLLDDEEKDAVILDAGTDAMTHLERFLIAPNRVASPGDLHDTRGYYRQIASNAEAFIQILTALTGPEARRPKFVIVAWHTQPPKDSGQQTTASADQKGEGIEYEGRVLPMIEGGYRRKIAGDFSCVAYTDIVPGGKKLDPKTKKMVESGPEYRIQVLADKDRHAKIAGMLAEGDKFMPNEFKALFERVGGKV